jgi:methylenetetrahydrofolate dehydrogenase (NADP+)/methenyltetrahydrofolate cyclohydrolase
MQLIDGKAVSEQIKKEIAQEVSLMKAAGKKVPHLAAILVGHDGGSETYVANKIKACQVCGFESSLLRFEETVSEETLLEAIDKLNKDQAVDGYIVQLPLPKHVDEHKIIEAIEAPASEHTQKIGKMHFRKAFPQHLAYQSQ